MFKIIATAKSRNIDMVANNFAEVLLSKGHRSKFQSELQKVIKHVLVQIENKDSQSMNSIVS